MCYIFLEHCNIATASTVNAVTRSAIRMNQRGKIARQNLFYVKNG